MQNHSVSAGKTAHPAAEELTAFGQGELQSEPVLERIEKHLAHCADCCEFLLVLEPGPFEQAVKAAEPAPAEAHRPLRIIAGYEILDELGRGGMGVVYRARQTGLGRIVALKQIRAGLVPGAEELSRFRREALVLARVQHPNIVQIHDVGEQEGVPYLAMEYVAGASLHEFLQSGPLAPRSAARLLATLARAISFAHGKGIIHRDLKPGNILLAKANGSAPSSTSNAANVNPEAAERLPKIADFGLAKLVDAEENHTRTGAVLGTPAYMAPELPVGSQPGTGAAIDIYALGAILYECLTGRPPFRGTTDLETLEQARTLEPVPPKRLRPALPRDLETISLKCLAKTPGGRYPTAADLADDLERFLRGEPIRGRRAGLGERSLRYARRRPAVAGLVALAVASLVGAIGGIAWHTTRLQQEIDRADAQSRNADRARLRADENYRQARATVDRMLSRIRGSMNSDIPGLLELMEQQSADSYEFFTKLAESQDHADAQVLSDLADSCIVLGNLHVRMGRMADALARFEEALRHWRELHDQDPDAAYYRRQLAGAQTLLGQTLASVPDTAARGIELLREAVSGYGKLLDEDRGNTDYTEALAWAHHNLGASFIMQGKLAEAEPDLLRAVSLRTGMLKAQSDPIPLMVLIADGHTNLGLICTALKRPRDAAEALGKAVAALTQAINKYPDNREYPLSFGAACLNWSNLVREQGDARQAAELCTRGIEQVAPLLQQEPNFAIARDRLFNLHGARAQAFDALRDFAHSAADWKEAAGLATEDNWRLFCRLNGGLALIHNADHAAAAREAEELAVLPNLTGGDYYNLACILAEAAAAVLRDQEITAAERPEMNQQYAQRAVELLRRAESSGFFREPPNVENFRADADLESLRERADFRELTRKIDSGIKPAEGSN